MQLLVVAQGAAGSLGGSADCLPTAVDRLAQGLNLPVRTIGSLADPQQAMAQLTLCRDPWLAAFPVDPGLGLDCGDCWAELLGAWRQPSLLVLEHVQLATGLPAAGTALLQRWQVPLVGLIQWGGPWNPDARRRDGLPWLGCLAGQPAELAEPSAVAVTEVADEALVLRLRWRWAQLDRLRVT